MSVTWTSTDSSESSLTGTAWYAGSEALSPDRLTEPPRSELRGVQPHPDHIYYCCTNPDAAAAADGYVSLTLMFRAMPIPLVVPAH